MRLSSFSRWSCPSTSPQSPAICRARYPTGASPDASNAARAPGVARIRPGWNFSLATRLVPRVQGRRNLIEDIRRCLRGPHRFLDGTGWPSGLLPSSALRGTAPTLLSESGLELLRWDPRSSSLVPRHERSLFAVNDPELFLGRTACELE